MALKQRQRDIDETVKQKLLDVLGMGGTLEDAADYAGVDQEKVRRLQKRDRPFARTAREFVSKNKLFYLKKVGTATPWQAAAFMLERKWPQEYGRESKGEKSGEAVRIRVRRVQLPPKTQGPGAESSS